MCSKSFEYNNSFCLVIQSQLKSTNLQNVRKRIVQFFIHFYFSSLICFFFYFLCDSVDMNQIQANRNFWKKIITLLIFVLVRKMKAFCLLSLSIPLITLKTERKKKKEMKKQKTVECANCLFIFVEIHWLHNMNFAW